MLTKTNQWREMLKMPQFWEICDVEGSESHSLPEFKPLSPYCFLTEAAFLRQVAWCSDGTFYVLLCFSRARTFEILSILANLDRDFLLIPQPRTSRKGTENSDESIISEFEIQIFHASDPFNKTFQELKKKTVGNLNFILGNGLFCFER